MILINVKGFDHDIVGTGASDTGRHGMARKEFMDLAMRIETASTLDQDLRGAALHGLRAAFPTEATAGHVPDEVTLSSDAVVEMVIHALPGWHFNIHGRARHSPGSWSCSLRRSDVLDDDEVLGTGEARSLHQAVLAAVLRVVAWR